jgi:hypothetical protein
MDFMSLVLTIDHYQPTYVSSAVIELNGKRALNLQPEARSRRQSMDYYCNNYSFTANAVNFAVSSLLHYRSYCVYFFP